MSGDAPHNTLTDDELLAQFEDQSLPFDRWTHRAHVRVAYIYLSRYPFDNAYERLSKGIRAYNAHHNVPEGPTRGYNETTTRAFAQLVAATIHAYGTAFPTKNSDEFCDTHPQLMTRNVLRLFYSPARRLDPRAKATYVEPDLAPLPRVNGVDVRAPSDIGTQLP